MSDSIKLVQGTDEWKQARIGSLGASVLHEVIAKTKSGYSASRANRMAKLLLERLTGQAQDTYQSAAMIQGKEREPEARDLYALLTGKEVKECGLFRHPFLIGTHASPDGLVGHDGLLECKCPEPAAHLETILNQAIPDKYVVQMLWQMKCGDKNFCDYVSYNPDFPSEMRIWIKRVERNETRIREIEQEVQSFLVELDAKQDRLAKLYGNVEAA